MGAVRIIIVHNHVVGPAVPSARDMQTSLDLKAACKAVRLEYVDHYLVTRTREVVSVEEFMVAEVRRQAREVKRMMAAKKRAAAKRNAKRGKK
jgi:flagellar biosynthesis GTPase FlhF